jgi:hypothetical protein
MKKNKLHKLAPLLSKNTFKNSALEIPANYFDSIEDAVLAKIKARELKKISRDQIFETPENYFDNVDAIIIAKLKAEALQNSITDTIPKPYFDAIEDVVLHKIKTNSRILSLKNNTIKYAAPFAIAASILLLVILNSSKKTITFDSIATSDIEASIDDGLIDIDADNLVTIFSDIELNESDLIASLSDDEVLDYLSNEDLDEIMYEN